MARRHNIHLPSISRTSAAREESTGVLVAPVSDPTPREYFFVAADTAPREEAAEVQAPPPSKMIPREARPSLVQESVL